MSEPENFLSRWARRKSEAETPSADGACVAAQPEVNAEAGLAAANPEPADPDPELPDLESLPAVESITETTDISGFLRSGVPSELTRSALRRAWASDPAIRDFIGIAENQWDFNDPESIPGFGLLDGTEDRPSLLAQAIGQVRKIGDAISNPAVASAEALPASAPDTIVRPTDPGTAEPTVAVQASLTAAEDETHPGHPRRHGSALPQ
jgi:hypothetical protein